MSKLMYWVVYYVIGILTVTCFVIAGMRQGERSRFRQQQEYQQEQEKKPPRPLI